MPWRRLYNSLLNSPGFLYGEFMMCESYREFYTAEIRKHILEITRHIPVKRVLRPAANECHVISASGEEWSLSEGFMFISDISRVVSMKGINVESMYRIKEEANSDRRD